jgi:nitrogenase molybdenum-iron protein beta chain
LSENTLSGSNGKYFNGWRETSSTNVTEKHVVFGGTSRLREQIKNTIKVINGDFYIVLTGCVPELVGDDLQAMVKEAQEQGFPVIGIATPGFKGDVYKGYEIVLKGIIDQIERINKPIEIQHGLVNILGIVPNQDLFWDGNLSALESLLDILGLHSNKLFGFEQGIDSWLSIGHAQLNLVISPWGLEIARHLEDKYNIPYIDFGWLPTGSEDTTYLLELIEDKLGIQDDLILKKIRSKEAKLKYQLQKVAEHYFKYDFQKEVAVVGETSIVIGITRFLQNTFGLIVKNAVITDNPKENIQKRIIDTLNDNSNVHTKVSFLDSGNEIDNLLLKSKPEFILGSSLEQSVAKALGVPLVKISTPVYERVVLNRSYTGYSGAITLIEDIGEQLLNAIQPEKLKKDYFKTLQLSNSNQVRLVSIN